MEMSINPNAYCAACEYYGNKKECPLYKSLNDAARNRGNQMPDMDLRFHVICDKFEFKEVAPCR